MDKLKAFAVSVLTIVLWIVIWILSVPALMLAIPWLFIEKLTNKILHLKEENV